MHVPDSRVFSWPLLIWALLAGIAGVLSFVLPSYLIKADVPQPPYGHPLIAWFAFAMANLRVVPSMVCFFAAGFVLGLAQPRFWLLLACIAMAMLVVLNGANILHDWMHDPTSHNLFPFEFAILGFVCWPAVLGAFLGCLCRRLFRKTDVTAPA